MAAWTVSVVDVSCGSCGRVIRADEPFQVLTSKRLIRCATHASGPVDDVEVDLERARIEMDRERQALKTAQGEAAPVVRHARVRSPQGFKSLMDAARPLFDAKAVAAGGDR
jgi:hypothetical protein